MISTQEKKINNLGNPEYYLVTTNEYKLDIIPSSLFSIDILDSQILSNNVSTGKSRHENYHMIHIMSIENSIWQVEVWLKIYFRVKSNKNFIHSPRKGVPFTFHPEIVYLKKWVMYYSDYDKVMLQFARNTVIVCDGSNYLAMMDPYNSIEANIHKDLVGCRGAFMLVIDARREEPCW